MLSHLFDDTLRMVQAMDPVLPHFDRIIGIPYWSNRPEIIGKWKQHFGDEHRSLSACRRHDQKLILQECGGFVVPLLHQHFARDLRLVKGVVEITKQGVWRSESLQEGLQVSVLHCADSELKRLEAKRCGETIARCLDGLARNMGLSLTGKRATVFGAGWIGASVAMGLRRLDMIPCIVDPDPLKVMESRLKGFSASTKVVDEWLHESHLVVGATGRESITAHVLNDLPDGAIVASASSRQLEIDVDYLKEYYHCRSNVSNAINAYYDSEHGRSILLVNDGFPANFIPGSGSVADEIVETILAELIVLMHSLTTGGQMQAGVHRISPSQERACSDLWLQLRDEGLERPTTRVAATPREVAKITGSVSPNPRCNRSHSQVPLVSQQIVAHHTSTKVPGTPKFSGYSTPISRGFSTIKHFEAISTESELSSSATTAHSPYLAQKLIQQEKPKLYGVAKFAVVADEIRKIAQDLDRPVRILDLGCSTRISKQYLFNEHLNFEYCGVDYEEAFGPDLCMDIRQLHQRKHELPWEPDVILLLDVLEHLPGKAQDIAQVMAECDKLIPQHGVVLAVVPQLYRMDRLKLNHLHYSEHQVRFTLDEWHDIIRKVTTVSEMQGIGYLSCLPYLPMLSPFYREDNLHGSLFRYLRGNLFEFPPLKPIEKWLSRTLGKVPTFKGWCNSSLLICQGSSK